MPIFSDFANDANGAATVDWIVLFAAVMGVGVITLTYAGTGASTLGDKVETALTDVEVAAVQIGQSVIEIAEDPPELTLLTGWHNDCEYLDGQLLRCASPLETTPEPEPDPEDPIVSNGT